MSYTRSESRCASKAKTKQKQRKQEKHEIKQNSLRTRRDTKHCQGLVHELPPLGTTWVWCGKESRSRIADKAWSAARGWRECRRYRARAKGRMPSTPLVYGGPCFFRFAGFLCCWALPIRILSCLRFAAAWGASPRRFRWARNLCQELTQ